jgi:hypothetical protein
MRRDRDAPFDRLARAVERALKARGAWRLDEVTSHFTSRDYVQQLGGGLTATLTILPDDGDLWATVSLGCAPAQQLVETVLAPAMAAIECGLDDPGGDGEYSVALSDDLAVDQTAQTVAELAIAATATLAAQAPTADDLARCLATDPERAHESVLVQIAVLAVTGRVSEAQAVLHDLLDTQRIDQELGERFASALDGTPPSSDQANEIRWPTWASVKARATAERAALEAMRQLGPDAPVEVRRATLQAALASHGLERTPSWIAIKAQDRAQGDVPGLLRVGRDLVRSLRAVRSGGWADDPIPIGHGPELEVELAPDAHPALAGAHEAAARRLGSAAFVTATLRAGGDGQPTTVLLDGVVVGHLDTPIGGEDLRAQAQITRLAASQYHLQLRLPRAT